MFTAPLPQPTGPQIDIRTGLLTEEWKRYYQALEDAIAGTYWVYASTEMATTFASVPTGLGPTDAGFRLLLTDFGHRFLWTGTAWEFADQGSGYFQDFGVPPPTAGWKLCDGTATTYLTVGAMIAEVAFTTPNLNGSPAYRKSAAAYTGTITAASAPSVSGATGSTTPTLSGSTAATTPSISGTVGVNTVNISGATANATATISGATANESAHTHGVDGTTGAPSATTAVDGGVGTSVASNTHDHLFSTTSGAGSAHSHDKGTLAVDAHSHGTGTLAGDSHDHPVGSLAVGSHTHALGTLAVGAHTHPLGTLAVDAAGEPARMGVLVYFRR